MMSKSAAALVTMPAAGMVAPRVVIQRAEALIARASALVASGDPLAGLDVAANAQRTMRIYSRLLTEAKATGRISNLAIATRLKAERVAGNALIQIDKSQGGRPKKNRLTNVTGFQDAIKQVGITKVTAARWQDVAKVPESAFDNYVSNVDRDRELTTRELVEPYRSERRRRDREEKLNTIARGGSPLAVVERFPVLYVDPPWQYEHVKTENRAIENHYPTMSLDALCDMADAITAATTEDCVLFLWATSPKLAEAIQVIAAWRFSYRSSMVWVKPQIGMGYWARQQHELLLIATKGNPPTPAPGDRPASVIQATRGAHSVKPIAFYEAIERMFPALPRIELFARSPRKGWKPWGNQVSTREP